MLIADPANDILVSAALPRGDCREVAHRQAERTHRCHQAAVVRGSLERLAITPAHLAVLSSLPLHHRDPFDHLLIAQAIAEDVLFMSDDQNMPLYLVQLMACTAP